MPLTTAQATIPCATPAVLMTMAAALDQQRRSHLGSDWPEPQTMRARL
jgi:hypothetical protein